MPLTPATRRLSALSTQECLATALGVPLAELVAQAEQERERRWAKHDA